MTPGHTSTPHLDDARDEGPPGGLQGVSALRGDDIGTTDMALDGLLVQASELPVTPLAGVLQRTLLCDGVGVTSISGTQGFGAFCKHPCRVMQDI